MPENFTYVVEELIEHIREIDFYGEPLDTRSRAEQKLRELYNLPNIAQDESALVAVAEYTASKEGDEFTLEQFAEYAGLFVQFFKGWSALADEHLSNFVGAEIERYLTYIDLDRLGRDVADDEDAFEVADGRIAQFNKKEGA